MKILKALHNIYLYIFYIFFMFDLISCDAEVFPHNVDTPVENSDFYSDPDKISIDELRKKVKQTITFDEIKNMSRQEIDNFFSIRNYFANLRKKNIKDTDRIIWLKDFKQWKIHELSTPQIYILSFWISILGERKEIIDNDEVIFHFTWEQLNSLTVEQLEKYYNINIEDYPVEYIKRLDNEKLRVVSSGLSSQQILALSNKRIIESYIISEISWCKDQNNSANGVIFPPNRIKKFGKDLKKINPEIFSCFNKEQLSVLTPEQISYGTGNQGWYWEELWFWTEKQLPWFSLEQIPGLQINQYTTITPEQAQAFSDEQLEAFSSEQVVPLLPRQLRSFLPEQLKILIKINAENSDLNKVVHYHSRGKDIFKDFPDFIHFSIKEHLLCLMPEQFSSLSLQQVESLPFDFHIELTPEQIFYMPHFVKTLDYYEVAQKKFDGDDSDYYPYGREFAIHEHLKNIRQKHGTTNRLHLLSKEQIKAIQPKQMPDFINEQIQYIFYKFKKEDSDGIDFTTEQLTYFTLEQFKFLFTEIDSILNSNWYLEHTLFPDEYLHTLSIEKIDFLLDDMSTFCNKYTPCDERLKQLTTRRQELVEHGDVVTTPKPKSPYSMASDNYLDFLINGSDEYPYEGICRNEYKQLMEEIAPNPLSDKNDNYLSHCIGSNMHYNANREIIFEGCTKLFLDSIDDEEKGKCDLECLYMLIEKKVEIWGNYRVCLGIDRNKPI